MGKLGIPSSVVILSIIILTGFLGGLRNWLAEDFGKSHAKSHFVKRLLDGMIASASIPLFLSVIGNEKITPAFGDIRPWNPDYQRALFILTGFCALAAFLSQRFLDSLSNRVMQLSDEVKEVKHQVEQSTTISDLQIEPDVRENLTPNTPESNSDVSEAEKKLLKSLTSGQFLVRSRTGLASETKLNPPELQDALARLEKLDLARKIETGKGERWGATENGRALASKIREIG